MFMRQFLPIDFGQFFWDMDFTFVLPIIHINYDKRTDFEVNRTQNGHFISKNHWNGHISKAHFAEVSFTKKHTPPGGD